MSDHHRKDLSDRISQKLTPNHSKSTVDRAGEHISSAADRVAGGVQPDSTKSASQSAADKVSREERHISHTGNESLLDKAKHALGLGHGHHNNNINHKH